MKLIPVHPENLHLAWKDVESYVEQGLEHADGKYNAKDIHELIRQEKLILWVVYNTEKVAPAGCIITEVLQYPRVRVLSVFLLAGDDLSQIMTLLDDLIDYGHSAGCKKMEFYGRSGWEKALKSSGFEKIHIVMRLNI